MVIIHCSATKPGMDIGVKEIREWHKARGWQDIGYHYVIRRDGKIEDGRDLDGDGNIFEEVGAHTVGYNKNSIGICMVGGINDSGAAHANFTKEQWATLPRLLRMIKAQFPAVTIHGHNEFNAGKACPSFNVQTWLLANKL